MSSPDLTNQTFKAATRFYIFKIGREKGKEIKKAKNSPSVDSINEELIVSPKGKETGHEAEERVS